MAEQFLPYGRQSIDDDDVEAVVAQLRDPWLTQGPTVARFEAALAEATNARHVVAVANGTAALHLACLAAGLKAGDVALVPDITFVATANAVRYAGATPVLVDVDPETGLASASNFEERLREVERRGGRVRALLPVSLTGTPADLPAIRRLARDVGATVIEDAAHSLGGAYAVENATQLSASCAHSDMAILSFHPVKHLTTAEGGAITTNDAGLARTLADLRSHGITRDASRIGHTDEPWYYEQVDLGFNYRLTDLQCALGTSQAKKLPRFLERRREIAAQYDEAFAGLADTIRPLRVREGTRSAYHLYVLQLVARPGEAMDALAARRKALFVWLRERGIGTQVHYIPVHRQPDFVRNGLSTGSFPGADAYYAGCISIPMFPAMTDADVARVVSAIREWSTKPEAR